ncbi:hypothetical protein IKT64_03265 [Candidatus Saccharibacteria bacterium]|nr:hypothetical protein [Candidatus Saccharibacteria bacterium]
MNEKPETKPETLEDKIQAVSAPVAASEAKVKRGTGWKVATIILAIFAIAGCGGLCYLFFVDNSISLLGRTITSSKTATNDEPKEEPKDEPKTEPKKELPKYDGKVSFSENSDKATWYFLFEEVFIRLDGWGGKVTDFKYSEDYGGTRRLTIWYYTCLEGGSCDDVPSYATKEGNEFGLAEIEIFDGLEYIPADASNRQYVGTINGDKEVYVSIFDKDWREQYNLTVPGNNAHEQNWFSDATNQLESILTDIYNYSGTDY